MSRHKPHLDPETGAPYHPLAHAQGATAQPLIKGAVYHLKDYGPAEYVGIDVYGGETTHQFKIGRTNRFLRPDMLTEQLATASRTPAGCWHPIETAPCDGTSVLIAEADRGSIGEGYYDYAPDQKRWYWANTGAGDYPDPREPSPTHWMPLPSPPHSSTDRPPAAWLEAKKEIDAGWPDKHSSTERQDG